MHSVPAATLAVAAVLVAAGVPPAASGAVRPAPVEPGPSAGAVTATPAPAGAAAGVATPAPEDATGPDDGTTPDDGTPAASGARTPAPAPETAPANVTARTRTSPAGVTVTLFLNCTLLSVTVTPGDHLYYLRLAYRDGVSGRRVRVAGGPFRGESEDHFGRTAFTLLSVVVRLQSGWTVAGYAPRACLDGDGGGAESDGEEEPVSGKFARPATG